MIYIQSRHTPLEKIAKKYPGATILDVTSRGPEPWVKFSPFYPLGEIPVPFSPGRFGQSVEGIWQGLKVFESEGVDMSRFEVTNMKGLKRTVRKYGKCLGHQKGLDSNELLPYIEARKQIYKPIYDWVLAHKLTAEVDLLVEAAQKGDVVLLDYETNPNIEFAGKPLSHAGLVREWVQAKI